MGTAFTTAFTALLGYMTETVETIIGEPVLLIPTVIFTIGGTIGLAKRLMGR